MRPADTGQPVRLPGVRAEEQDDLGLPYEQDGRNGIASLCPDEPELQFITALRGHRNGDAAACGPSDEGDTAGRPPPRAADRILRGVNQRKEVDPRARTGSRWPGPRGRGHLRGGWLELLQRERRAEWNCFCRISTTRSAHAAALSGTCDIRNSIAAMVVATPSGCGPAKSAAFSQRTASSAG